METKGGRAHEAIRSAGADRHPAERPWEASVRATHLFLSNEEIAHIKTYVPQALAAVPHRIVAERTPGVPVGFLGVAGDRLETLFLAPSERGQGTGRQLLQYGVQQYGIRTVTVNEQNPQAVGFYQHLGFVTYQRTDQDLSLIHI